MRRLTRSAIPILLGGLLGTAGCSDPIDPRAIAGTWVASAVNGQPLPLRLPRAVGEMVYEADTLVFQVDGRFSEHQVSVWVHGGLEDRRVRQCTGEYYMQGSRLTLWYHCERDIQEGPQERVGRFPSADRLELRDPEVEFHSSRL